MDKHSDTPIGALTSSLPWRFGWAGRVWHGVVVGALGGAARPKPNPKPHQEFPLPCHGQDSAAANDETRKLHARPHRGGPRRSGITLTVLVTTGVLVASLAGTSAANTSSTPASSVAAETQAGSGAMVAKGKARSHFPGYRPGRIYLGMSCGEQCPQKESQLGMNFGLKRSFKKWGNWGGVAESIREDRRKHRLPWISIEGPRGTPDGWRDVGLGKYDHDIRQLATVLKHNDRRPLFLSFDHEMSNNLPDAQGHWWARGFNRFHDVLQRAHALKRVSLAPLPVSWLFDPHNSQDANAWLPRSVLRRSDFMGVDLYQNSSGKAYGQRLPQVDRWLGRHGHKGMMIGLGETGATSKFGNVSGASWLNRSLQWAAHNRSKVVAISYFNSTANSDPNVYWPLDESPTKMSVYRKWLKTQVFINRVR